MRKVIDKHLYDTETAREMARYGANLSDRLRSVRETLYRTKAGLYFIHGVGGPMTRYAETISQNEWSGGERILPISEEAAMKWTEEHCDSDTYERIFGGPSSGPTRQLNIRLSRADAERFEAIKKASGMTYTELLSGWIWSQKV